MSATLQRISDLAVHAGAINRELQAIYGTRGPQCGVCVLQELCTYYHGEEVA